MKQRHALLSNPLILALVLALPATASAFDAELIDDTLIISGNQKNDSITVSGDGFGGIYVSSGRAATNATRYSPAGDLSINLKGGNNKIVFEEFNFAGSVKIKTGSGNDKLHINGALIVGGDLIVELQGGNNTVKTSAQSTINVAGNASFDANKGKDRLMIKNITTAGHLIVDTAGGDDNVQLGTKNKYTVNVGGGLNVIGGKGRNTIALYGADVVSTVSLISGSDVDKYTILDNKAGVYIDVRSGGSNDRIVSKNNTVSGEYHIHCGSGTDKLVSKQDSAAPAISQRCVN